MAKFNFKPVIVHVPQYGTDATIKVDENHQSGRPHLVVEYELGGYNGNKDFAAAIPEDWTDQDIQELIELPIGRTGRANRDWPAWEVAANDYASFSLFRFWKGEKPPSN